MGKIANQSLQTALFSYLGVVIGYFNVLWLFPYALEASQLGTFRTIQDLGLLFVPFAQLGLGHGITRYFPKLESNQSAFLSFSILLAFVGFGLVCSVFLIFKSQIVGLFSANSPEVINFLQVVLLITFFSLLSSILDAYARSYLKIAVPTFFREVLLRLLTGILVGTYFLDLIPFELVMNGLVFVYGITTLAVLIYLLWLKVLKFDFNWNNFPVGFRSSFLRFSLITFLATAASTLIMKIDSIMVSSMVNLEANAIYTIAFSMALVIELPRRAISQVVMPVVADYFANGRLVEINKLYKQVSNRQLYICLLLFIGIWANIDYLYYLIPKREIYETGKYVVFLIGLGKLFDVIFSINSEILVFSKYYRFNLIATIVMSLMIIGMNYWLIPIFGIEGAAMASALVMLIFNLVKYLYLKTKMRFDPFSKETLKIIFVGVLAYLPFHFIQFELNPILSMILTSGGILMSYLIFSMLIGAGKEEWNWVRERIKNKQSGS